MGVIKTIGIIGAGNMGNGIAYVAAVAGYDVCLYDISQQKLDDALATINGNMARHVASNRLDETVRKQALTRLRASLSLDDIGMADFVVEAAIEDEMIKRGIFVALCRVLNPKAILATNSSTLSITRLASVTDRPERFIGLHFMNPVPMMKLVEVVRGIATDEDTFQIAKGFITSLGKTITVAEDFPAFIVNRVLLPMINEAIYALYEGVGTAEAIDTALHLGANHPMGPLQLADFIGLDTCLAIMQALHEGLADSKYRPCPLLVKYVEAGWLGRKTGRGFYDYRSDNPSPSR